jgi:hypothetical protein
MPSSLKPADALNALRRSNIILNDLLRAMTQEQAVAARDGADGWNVVEIVCHLRDLEDVYQRRVVQMTTEDNPRVLAFDVAGAVTANDYAHADLREALALWNERRAASLAQLSALAPEQWERTGVHPEYGAYTVLDAVLRTALHDVNHTEQVLKALGRAQ